MILKTVIVDDEDLAIDLLRHFINSQPEFQLLETFTSSKNALEYIKKHQPDVFRSAPPTDGGERAAR